MTVIISPPTALALLELLAVVLVSQSVFAESALFLSRQVTPSGEYTFGIEGPAVDEAGNLYVVNYLKQGTIGKLPSGGAKSELFAELPQGSIASGIRFGPDQRMYIADYKNHNIFVFERGKSQPRVYFHSRQFNQPNDLTVARDGTIFASDPHWRRRDGRIWRITRGSDGSSSGEVMSSDRAMTTTNGLDLSPDGETLHVGKSETREIWSYRLDGAKLVLPRLLKKFADFSIDGLRTDIDGRVYVTRILKGTIAVLSPEGMLEREIPLVGKEPTNIAFGGLDGKTAYVTQRQGGFIKSFRVKRPGREYCVQSARQATCK